MRPADWEAAAALFTRALAEPEEEREGFIDAACGSDSELARQVKRMIRADARGSNLLDATPDELAAVVVPEVPLLEGRRIGPYTVDRVLARGGMGIVCLARRDDVGKEVAIKLVAGGLGSPERVSRFMLERRVLASLQHPDIAPLLDAGITEDGTPWLAMEYVAGRSIDAYCEGTGLDIRGRLGLFERVARAVGYAHRHLIVHRDLKPSNILVTEGGEPRLVDFGIAKPLAASGGESALTAAGEALMTPQYASPEQVTGGTITTASDIYQLGVLLFELLTGTRPPSARDGELSRPSHVAGLPSQRQRRLEGDLDTIVLKATRREPPERYATAEQLADDVRRHLDGLPVLARPASAGYQVRKFIGRHRAATGAALVSVLALAGFSLAMGVQRRRTEAERVRAEQVSDLLVEIFAGADPTVAQGATITVNQVLDRGAERVRRDSATDPSVRVRLLTVIAAAYENLGRLDRAVELQGDAVLAARGGLPPLDPMRLRALRRSATLLAKSGARERAYPLAEEVVAASRNLGARRAAELALALQALGFTHHQAGDYQTAERHYLEALAIHRSLKVPVAADVEGLLTNLGYVAQNRGDLEKEEAYFREVLDRRRARLGAEHSLAAKSMLDLSRVLAQRNKLDEAEPLVREATAIQRRVFAGPNSDLIQGMTSMARVLARRNQIAAAESSQREALALTRQLYGDSSGSTAVAIADLAGHVQRAGRLDEAAALHGDAIARFRLLLGDRHPTTAIAVTNLAYTEFLRKRYSESVRLYRLGLPVLDLAWAGTPRVGVTLVDYGMVLSADRKCDAAEAPFRRGLELAAASQPRTSVEVLRPRRMLGLCLMEMGRLAEAETSLVVAYESLMEGYGPKNPFTVAAAGDLVRLYERMQRPADAERYRTQ